MVPDFGWTRDNYNFTVQNCTFFGNHAGECYKNYEDGSFTDSSWAGGGFWHEGNPNGTFLNNVFYSNLTSGLSVNESGFDGGSVIIGNIFAGNSSVLDSGQ